GEEEGVPRLRRDVFHSFDNLRKVRFGDVGHHDADGLGPPGHQAAGGRVGLIPQLFRNGDDPLPGRFILAVLVVQRPGYHARSHPRNPSDILDGRHSTSYPSSKTFVKSCIHCSRFESFGQMEEKDNHFFDPAKGGFTPAAPPEWVGWPSRWARRRSAARRRWPSKTAGCRRSPRAPNTGSDAPTRSPGGGRCRSWPSSPGRCGPTG